MDERRKLPRKNLMSYTQVFDLYSGALLGYLADLNTLGAMIISEKPLMVNTELTLQIEVPEIQGVSAKRLSIPARVAWTRPDVSPEYHTVGFEFKEVKPEQVQVLEAIMTTYEFRRERTTYPEPPLD
jgi:Tfp pilus assembly protein PilZ